MADENKLPVPIRNEIATAQRDINRQLFGNIMLPNDDTLLTRGGARSYRIYDDIERDGRVFSGMQKRKLALLAYPISVTAASTRPIDVEAAELVKAQFKALNFRTAVMDLLDAILKGFAVGEVLWAVENDKIVAKEIRARDQRRFRFDTDYNLRLLTFENLLDGELLPDRKFIVHRYGAKDGNPYGLGLGTRLFWYAFFKRQDLSFWLTFNDKFGSPTAVGKYPAGTEPADQAKLLAALASLAQDAAIAIPEGMLVELLEATRSGTVDAYERLARYMDEQITEIILGETLSTSVDGGGSYAAAQTHNGVRLELSQADGELLAASLNPTLVKWIVELNLPGAVPPTLAWEVSQGEDLAQRATRDKQIYDMGFEPSEEYINETYGGQWTKRQMPTFSPFPQGQESTPPSEFAESGLRRLIDALSTRTRVSFADPNRKPDTVDHFAERLASDAGPAVEAMVGKVKEILDGATSLEDFRDRLIDAYPKISPAEFSEIMSKAVLSSDLAGRVEATQRKS